MEKNVGRKWGESREKVGRKWGQSGVKVERKRAENEEKVGKPFLQILEVILRFRYAEQDSASNRQSKN